MKQFASDASTQVRTKQGILQGYQFDGTYIFKGALCGVGPLSAAGSGGTVGGCEGCNILWIRMPADAPGAADGRASGAACVLAAG